MPIDSLLYSLLVVATVIAMVFVVRARRRSHAIEQRMLAEREVCPHLRPALDALLASGHAPVRIGQRAPDMPLEIHIAPPFDPRSVYSQQRLAEPALISERNVLYCKQCWCELHPAGR